MPISPTVNEGSQVGFTLVEVLASLVILALVAGMTLRLARPGDRLTVGALAAKAASLARRARDRAIATGQDATLRIDLVQRVIIAHGARPLSIPEDVTVEAITSSSEQVAGIGGIRFFADGSSTGGVIRLGRVGSQHEIRINWFSGRVRIDRPS
ncbi:MAG: prepilin-type N-terminal cleavage/methylation domain-containing protein [Hyphomicrobiaceae bacterium]|nr:prepilin-type N-terminal cleavage/methylation domain-containing protein [Hyphomicrobiaceae bacterium]